MAQEALWSHEGLGPSPNLSVLLEGGKASLILVGSPFQPGVLALDPRDGSVKWKSELTERISRPGRMLTDMALFSTHTGTLIALETGDGDEMWRAAAENNHDYAAVSPLIVEGSIFTLTEKGVLSRYNVNGERLNSRTIDTLWERQRAQFVPMWRDASGLSFLDQAGRIRSFNPADLSTLNEKRVTTAVGAGMGQLGSEVLGGVFSANQGWIWTTELSGLLRSSQTENGKTRWTASVGEPEDFYSSDGRVLSVPVLSLPPQQNLLVVTRHQASIFAADDGRVLQRHNLPSPAVAPPLFDLDRQTWWILTEDYLVALRWDGQIRSIKLPLLERPYTAALAGNLLVVGTAEGRIYAMPVPDPAPPAAPLPPSPTLQPNLPIQP